MKHLVSGSTDFIIKSRAVANKVEGQTTEWTDKNKMKCKGRNIAETILFYARQYNEFGGVTNITEVYLTAPDIVLLAAKIKEMEETILEVTIDDDLPY